MPNEKVLLVDDEQDFTRLLAERMEARGLVVDTAASGPAALARIETGAVYDAVLLDLAMPGMDGLETLRRMLAANPDLQVILLTGQATVDKGVAAAKLGARDLVEKPADLGSLLEKIAAAGADRVVLVEKRLQQRLGEILGSKGW